MISTPHENSDPLRFTKWTIEGLASLISNVCNTPYTINQVTTIKRKMPDLRRIVAEANKEILRSMYETYKTES